MKLLNINEEQLKEEEKEELPLLNQKVGIWLIWKIIMILHNIKYGYRHPDYDKACLFNRKYINEINYMHGAHRCNPIGTIKYSENIYKLYHYHYINLDFILERYKMTATRMSEANIKNRWGWHYWEPENEIKAAFSIVKAKAHKIL